MVKITGNEECIFIGVSGVSRGLIRVYDCPPVYIKIRWSDRSF